MTPDFSCFDSPDALALNKARQDHFDSLGIDLSGKQILEVGCGVGHFTKWLLTKGPRGVTGIDVRLANIQEARRRVPGATFVEADVESSPLEYSVERYTFSSTFDCVLCYGLLYHLENPLMAIRHMASYSKDLIAIESIVCDSWQPICLLKREDMTGQNQGMSNLAMVPSAGFLVVSLVAVGFSHIYRQDRMPDHPDFHWVPQGNHDIQRSGHNLREILIGSRTALANPQLRELTVL